MIAFHAHFDGKVIVPDGVVDLPRDQPFLVHVEALPKTHYAAADTEVSALQWLAENAAADDLPVDLSAQADHYLYGTPKRA